jgi:hypothetical protein
MKLTASQARNLEIIRGVGGVIVSRRFEWFVPGSHVAIRGLNAVTLRGLNAAGLLAAFGADGAAMKMRNVIPARIELVEGASSTRAGETAASESKTRQASFEADRAEVSRALQDARAYVTDFDSDGRKAEALYGRLARASRLMQPWSTDGTAGQAQKAVEYLREIASILSEKIGPASRREFPEQGGHHESAPTSREIEQDVADLRSQGRR